METVDLPQRVFEWYRAVGRVQIEDLDTLRAELREGGFELRAQDVRLMDARACGVDFRGEGEAAGGVVGGACEGFLGAVDVDTGGVEFIVACCLEYLQVGLEVGNRGDLAAFIGVWAVCLGLCQQLEAPLLLPNSVLGMPASSDR